jgi:hypothetical protein
MDTSKRIGGPQTRVYVATPAYDGKVDTDMAMSLAEGCMVAAVMGIHCTVCCMKNGAFIDLARNNFVQLFLETDCTHLFFIDADLKFEARAFVGLVTACTEDRPVVAGIYPRRQDNEEYPVKYVEAEDGGIQLKEGGWVECERVPTGFLCIRREVIEEMAEEAPKLKQHGRPLVPRLFHTYMLPDGRFIGEDFAWCDDYRAKYQRNIDVWPDFTFTHGGYEGNWHAFMNRKVEEWEAEQREKDV